MYWHKMGTTHKRNSSSHATKPVNMNKYYYAVFNFVMQEFKSTKTLFGSI